VAVVKRVLAVGAAVGFLLWLVSAAFNVPVVTELLRRTRRTRARDPRTRLMVVYERACRLLARAGLGRHPWQTPAEHTAAVAARCGGSAPPLVTSLEALTRALERARYSTGPVSADDVDAAQQSAVQMAQGLRELRRARRTEGSHGRRRPLDGSTRPVRGEDS